MKARKSIFALLLLVAFVLSSGVSVYAAEIQIEDCVSGQTYTAYKLFNVTHSTSYVKDAAGTYYHDTLANTYTETEPTNFEEDGGAAVMYKPSENYAYTIAADDDVWLPVILGYMGYTDFGGKWYAADQLSERVPVEGAVETVSPFTGKGMTLALAASAECYVVTVDNSFSAPDFAKELLDNKPAAAVGTAATAGEDKKVDITGLDTGYYLVTSSLGSLCSLDTAADTATVMEKNNLPTIAKFVREDDNNTTHEGLTADFWKESAILDVTDTASYKLSVIAGGGANDNYVIVDTMPTGFAYIADSITVECKDTLWTGGDYTVAYGDGELTVTLLAAGKLAGLADHDEIVITYDAAMTAADVTIGVTTGNVNTAKLTYKTKEVSDSATVYTLGLGTGFHKVDGVTGEALAGVKFILSKGNAYATAQNGCLTGWTNTRGDATAIETDANGTISVTGLDAGAYVLAEIETLPGYNLLEDTISVQIAADGTVAYQLTGKGTAANTMEIENNQGTVLPTTGGIGTTIFTVIGVVFMSVAVILLITKKRMSDMED